MTTMPITGAKGRWLEIERWSDIWAEGFFGVGTRRVGWGRFTLASTTAFLAGTGILEAHKEG